MRKLPDDSFMTHKNGRNNKVVILTAARQGKQEYKVLILALLN